MAQHGFNRCLECGLISPATMSGICLECKPGQDEWDESEDYLQVSPEGVLQSLFPCKETREMAPGEDGEPIPGTYIICKGGGRQLVSDDPELDQSWRAELGPLFVGA